MCGRSVGRHLDFVRHDHGHLHVVRVHTYTYVECSRLSVDRSPALSVSRLLPCRRVVVVVGVVVVSVHYEYLLLEHLKPKHGVGAKLVTRWTRESVHWSYFGAFWSFLQP